jgi:hypothetical protein
MAEDLGIHKLLPHLTFQLQPLSFPGGFRTACIGFVALIKLDDPVFDSFVNAHLLSP